MVITTSTINGGGGGIKNPKQGNQAIEDRGSPRPKKNPKHKSIKK